MADVDAYAAGIDALRDTAAQMFDDAAARLDFSTPRAAELSLQYLQGLYESLYIAMGDAADVLINEWLETVAAENGISLDELEADISGNQQARDYAERQFQKSLEIAQGGNVAEALAAMKSDLDARLSWRVRHDTVKHGRRGGYSGRKHLPKVYEFAWVPFGDTCAYCLAIASRGWVSTAEEINAFETHIHGGCDCKLIARVIDSGEFPEIGKQADEYARMYEAAKGNGNSNDAINALRREQYRDEETRERLRAQHREAYRRRQEAAEIKKAWNGEQ